jgi:hypothetical protein
MGLKLRKSRRCIASTLAEIDVIWTCRPLANVNPTDITRLIIHRMSKHAEMISAGDGYDNDAQSSNIFKLHSTDMRPEFRTFSGRRNSEGLR